MGKQGPWRVWAEADKGAKDLEGYGRSQLVTESNLILLTTQQADTSRDKLLGH